MGISQSRNNNFRTNMLIRDKRLILKYRTHDIAVKLWLKYSKLQNKTKEEREFLRYLECISSEFEK